MSQGDLLELAQKRVGLVLRGKYRLDSVLGVGGMATVYAATHRNRKRFAIKILHAHVSTVPDTRRRFLREGYVANTVDHPGAVAVLDDDVAEDGSAFLVMELLDGATLDALWRAHERRMPAPVVLAVADQVLAVLASAHAKSVIHRDIKPSNLFVIRDGTVKVLDFGIARLRDRSDGIATTGVALGTPAFMAPEMAVPRSAEVDRRSDVWAVGATMFTLASGGLVHEGETAEEMFVNAATRPVRSLADALPGADSAFIRVVDRALSFEPAARWPSADEMRKAVRAAIGLEPDAPAERARLASVVASLAPPVPETRTPSPLPPSVAPGLRAAATRTIPIPEGSGTAPPVFGGTPPSVPTRPRYSLLLGALALAGGVASFALVRRSSQLPPSAPPVTPATASERVLMVAPDLADAGSSVATLLDAAAAMPYREPSPTKPAPRRAPPPPSSASPLAPPATATDPFLTR